MRFIFIKNSDAIVNAMNYGTVIDVKHKNFLAIFLSLFDYIKNTANSEYKSRYSKCFEVHYYLNRPWIPTLYQNKEIPPAGEDNIIIVVNGKAS